jgi:hypothetical protein
MEVACSSETPIDFQWTTRPCILEERTFLNQQIPDSTLRNVPSQSSLVIHQFFLESIKYHF